MVGMRNLNQFLKNRFKFLTIQWIGVGSFQGFLLFGLLVADARMTIASRILGVICLMIAVTFLIPFLLANADKSAIGWTIGLVFFLPVALGPLGYLYSRSALLGTPLTKKDLLHLIPWLFS